MISSQKLVQKIKLGDIYQNIYKSISPVLFDVSLRDGIQNAECEKFDTHVKKQIFHNIMDTQVPQYLEIGSLASFRFLPIMKDTVPLYHYTKEYVEKNNKNTQTCVLVPSLSKLNAAFLMNLTHYSFITSVSNRFQLKNICKTLEDTKKELNTMCHRINEKYGSQKIYKKLYISCITHCPIEGEIPNDFIVDELMYYNQYPFDELCLSDTCGKLTLDNFSYIMEKAFTLGISRSKISIHIHVSGENREEIRKILFYCFDNKINKFDVSVLEYGGCNMTLCETVSNLSYELFYSILYEYILAKVGKKLD